MDAPTIDRMIGCANCRAAAPITARFCPRCGSAMVLNPPSAATPATATPVAWRETPAEREARVEAAVDRMLPDPQLGGVGFVTFIIGCVALAAHGVPVLIGLLIAGPGALMMLIDVRRHVRIREQAERDVAQGRPRV
jgi:hypothetical protein